MQMFTGQIILTVELLSILPHCMVMPDAFVLCLQIMCQALPNFWNLKNHRSSEEGSSADFDDDGLVKMVNQKADGGLTPLHMVALNGHVECVQLLLDLGACVSEVTIEDGTTIDLIGKMNQWFLQMVEKRKRSLIALMLPEKASHPGLSSSLSNQITVVPTPLHPAEPSDLRFNRLQPSIEESDCKYKRFFGCYVAREAIIDEEYWIASWLRAEDRYEDQSGDRHVESFKRKFASQEFHALKTRCSKQVGEKYICFVAVKNDDIKRNVLNSVVGTLDVCVRHPLHGEKFPTEPGKSPFHCRIYEPDQPRFGYLTNVCVAKYARRQGIASNMLLLATDAARLNGAENIYIHVHKDNLPARRLYDEIGFKKVDMDGARQSSDLCLLSFSS